MRRRRMVQTIPGFPIYSRRSSSVYKLDSSDAGNHKVSGGAIAFWSFVACALLAVPTIRAIKKEQAIASFDQMQPSAQTEILRRNAIGTECITGYQKYKEDDDDTWRYRPEKAVYSFDNLEDFQAYRNDPACTVIADNFPNGPGK